MITQEQNHLIDVLESKGFEVVLEGDLVFVNDTKGNTTTMEFVKDGYIEFLDSDLRNKTFRLDQERMLVVAILNKFRL